MFRPWNRCFALTVLIGSASAADVVDELNASPTMTRYNLRDKVNVVAGFMQMAAQVKTKAAVATATSSASNAASSTVTYSGANFMGDYFLTPRTTFTANYLYAFGATSTLIGFQYYFFNEGASSLTQLGSMEVLTYPNIALHIGAGYRWTNIVGETLDVKYSGYALIGGLDWRLKKRDTFLALFGSMDSMASGTNRTITALSVGIGMGHSL